MRSCTIVNERIRSCAERFADDTRVCKLKRNPRSIGMDAYERNAAEQRELNHKINELCDQRHALKSDMVSAWTDVVRSELDMYDSYLLNSGLIPFHSWSLTGTRTDMARLIVPYDGTTLDRDQAYVMLCDTDARRMCSPFSVGEYLKDISDEDLMSCCDAHERYYMRVVTIIVNEPTTHEDVEQTAACDAN